MVFKTWSKSYKVWRNILLLLITILTLYKIVYAVHISPRVAYAKNKKLYISAIYYSISTIFLLVHFQEINPINRVH